MTAAIDPKVVRAVHTPACFAELIQRGAAASAFGKVFVENPLQKTVVRRGIIHVWPVTQARVERGDWPKDAATLETEQICVSSKLCVG